jgi:prepilin-type N-terminal cleavage/methylation domain-containing protein
MVAPDPARGRRGRTGQGGVTLIEVLVAVVILGMTVAGVSAMTGVMTRAGGTANQNERAQVLLSAFGEAVSNLPYIPCAGAHLISGQPSYDNYQDSFDQTEDALSEHDRNLRNATHATLTVVTVDGQVKPLDGCIPASDLHTQRIALSVTVGKSSASGVIVKNDRTPLSPRSNVRIVVDQQSAPGDVEVVLGLHAEVEGTGTAIVAYKWYCDGDAVPNDPSANWPSDFTTNAADDPSVVCSYPAPTTTSPASEQTARPAVLTTDEFGYQRVWRGTFPLSTTPAAHNPPFVSIGIVTQTQCLSSTAPKCTEKPIRFRELASPFSGDAVFTKLVWNFGDHSPEVTCSDVTDACIQQSHTYAGGGTFVVSLHVTDSLGATGDASITIYVAGTELELPQVDFTMSPQSGVVPQTVAFHARVTSSTGVTAYKWTFGDGLPGAGSISTVSDPTHTYKSPGTGPGSTFDVTLTVTAGNGTKNSKTQTITLTSLAPLSTSPPTSFTNVGAIAQKWCLIDGLFCHGHPASFTFTWFNVASSPGDVIYYEIHIRSDPQNALSLCASAVQHPDKKFTVSASGGAGSFQRYTAQWTGHLFDGDIGCAGRYLVQTRTHRVVGGVEATPSAWSSEFAVTAQ